MRERHRRLTTLLAFGTLIAVACGGPKYPTCDTDEHCNADGHKGVCVDHKCVACRDDAACAKGETCRAGLCAKREGFCDEKNPCPGGAPCPATTCGPAKPGTSAPPVECSDEQPCKGAGERCMNGRCVPPDPGGPGCRDFGALYYAFESAELAGDAAKTIERLAGCLSKGSLASRKVLLTGHCDARGEYEFNMGLGAERAERARTTLLSLGVPADRVTTSSRGKLDAVGTDEDTMAKDRRVDIEVR
jgi:peptidoglycan-associated lipoprotein